MRLKLDENLGRSQAAILEEAGLDISTVVEQGMAGWTDADLFAACASEGRSLVTFDLDFADPFRFDPAGGPGVIVLRLSGRLSRATIAAALSRLVVQLRASNPAGHLWIVEPSRIRQYERGTAGDDG